MDDRIIFKYYLNIYLLLFKYILNIMQNVILHWLDLSVNLMKSVTYWEESLNYGRLACPWGIYLITSIEIRRPVYLL